MPLDHPGIRFLIKQHLGENQDSKYDIWDYTRNIEHGMVRGVVIQISRDHRIQIEEFGPLDYKQCKVETSIGVDYFSQIVKSSKKLREILSEDVPVDGPTEKQIKML